MHSYIIINHTHETCEVALFVNAALYRIIVDDKRHTSKMLIIHINSLLHEKSLSINDISFIGINQGPGLFSTLRSIIATVNALSFACAIPLIGIDALDATTAEFYNPEYPHTITLLDACNKEVYYAISSGNNIIEKGYLAIHLFLEHLQKKYPSTQFKFIGRGTLLYKTIIVDTLGSYAIIPDEIPQVCSVNIIAQLADKLFEENKNGQGYLLPLHLKKHPVER